MAVRRGTERDRRQRSLGQNFLVDRRLIDRFVASLDLTAEQLVVDIGAGTGALTVPMAEAGARVLAVEADPRLATRLRRTVADAGDSAKRIRVVTADARRLRLPRESYRVVANPPFGLTTALLSLLLDDPRRGPDRVDLAIQREVARKHATSPPVALRTAAWSPWWTFRLGLRIGRTAFRPRPAVDAQVLVIERRSPPVLPDHLSPGFREALRPVWEGAANRQGH